MVPITPLPIRDAAEGLLLVGGTFDPPHGGHTTLSDRARRAIGMEKAWLVFVPASVSPFKVHQRQGASTSDRLAMLRLAIEELPKSLVWTDEIDRAGACEEGGETTPSYWVETLSRLRSIVGPEAQIRFIIGSDQAAQFHRWREFREILRLAQPVVVLRKPISTPAELRTAMSSSGAWSESEIQEWVQRIAPVGLEPYSSTELRGLLGGGSGGSCSPGTAMHGLARGVIEYIAEHGLYQGGD